MSPTFVKDIMVKDVAYVSIPGNRDEVLKTLLEKRVSGIPVVKMGKVMGMITRTDLLKNIEEDQVALIMTRNPVVVTPQNTILEVSELLLRHNINRMPVVEDGTLVGIITVADIVSMTADLEIDESVERFYEKKILVLWSEMPLPVAGAIMEYAETEACPVIDSGLKLVGIISDRDLIKASVIEDTVEKTDMSSASQDDNWMWESVTQTMNRYYTVSRIKLSNIKVSEAMVPAITAFKKSKVKDCAITMKKNRIDQLPVITPGQKLIGILRDKDIIRALIEYYESSAK
ncbi:MAG: CBS domain-containing protein [Methanotrichaceae archaeon]|nr:CBS domain-containing protein [Methanotrichaceae archaeon]